MRLKILLSIVTCCLIISGCNKTESSAPVKPFIALAAVAAKSDSANVNSQGAQENLRYIQKRLIDSGLKAIILRPPYRLQSQSNRLQTQNQAQNFTPVAADDYLSKVKAFSKINKTAPISHLITLDMQAQRRALGRRFALQIRFSADITPMKGGTTHSIRPRERQITLSPTCQNYCLDQMILTQTRPIQDTIVTNILGHLGIKTEKTDTKQSKETANKKPASQDQTTAPIPSKTTTVTKDQLASLSYNMEVVGLSEAAYKAFAQDLQHIQKFRTLTLVTYKAEQNRYILRYSSGLSVVDLRSALTASLNKLGIKARIEIYGSLIILDARGSS